MKYSKPPWQTVSFKTIQAGFLDPEAVVGETKYPLIPPPPPPPPPPSVEPS